MNVLNQDKFYEVSCSDWSLIIKSSSPYEAACAALKKMMQDKGRNLNLSFILEIKQCNNEEDIEFLYVPSVLFDIGYFKLSEDFSELSNFFLDKGKNSH